MQPTHEHVCAYTIDIAYAVYAGFPNAVVRFAAGQPPQMEVESYCKMGCPTSNEETMHEPSIGTSARVVVWHEDSVLLGLNDRGEWELSGGRPESSDRRLVATVCRKLWEEARIEVGPAHLQLVDAELFEPVPDAWVSLVCYSARLNRMPSVTNSVEHSAVRFDELDNLPENLPAVYKRFINASRN